MTEKRRAGKLRTIKPPVAKSSVTLAAARKAVRAGKAGASAFYVNYEGNEDPRVPMPRKRKAGSARGRCPEFRWGEFLEERARMIRYFRDVDRLSWEAIAERLSCDPIQAELVYGGDCGRLPKSAGKGG